jgi:hypothetical protein
MSRLADRSTRTRWVARFVQRSGRCAHRIIRLLPHGSLDSLGNSLESLTASSPAALAGSFNTYPMVPSLRLTDLSTRTRCLVGVARQTSIRHDRLGTTSCSFRKDEAGSRTKGWLPYGVRENSNSGSDGNAKIAAVVVRDANPCSGGNAKPAAAGVRVSRQNFETPHPTAAGLVQPPLVLDCQVSCQIVFALVVVSLVCLCVG